MALDKLVIQAKCIAPAFDTKQAVQYSPGELIEFRMDREGCTATNLSRGTTAHFSRQLFWLKTTPGPMGRWVFQFDRANSSNTVLRIFFCKECGQPFDKFTELGTHFNSEHNKTKALVGKTQAEELDAAEEEAIKKLEQQERLEAAKAEATGKVASTV